MNFNLLSRIVKATHSMSLERGVLNHIIYSELRSHPHREMVACIVSPNYFTHHASEVVDHNYRSASADISYLFRVASVQHREAGLFGGGSSSSKSQSDDDRDKKNKERWEKEKEDRKKKEWEIYDMRERRKEMKERARNGGKSPQRQQEKLERKKNLKWYKEKSRGQENKKLNRKEKVKYKKLMERALRYKRLDPQEKSQVSKELIRLLGSDGSRLRRALSMADSPTEKARLISQAVRKLFQD